MVRIREEVALREHSPRDDAMSAITHHEIDGERIPRETAESIVFMTVGGGVDTTTALDRRCPAAPVAGPGRQATAARRSRAARDRHRGVPPLLPAGADARPHRDRGLRVRRVPDACRVTGCCSARSRPGVTPTRSPTADTFVIDRNPNRHLSFGVGIHRCVGSHLARIEFAEVITQILERLPDFEIDVDAVVEYPNWASVGGWAKLPATFTPGPRIATDVTLSPAGRPDRRSGRRGVSGARSPATRSSRWSRPRSRRSATSRCSCCTASRARRTTSRPCSTTCAARVACSCSTSSATASRRSPTRPYTLAEQADIVDGVHRCARVERLALLTHDMGDTVGGELLARQLDGTWPVEVTPPGAHQRQHLHRDGAAQPGPAAAARAPRRDDGRGDRRSTPRRCRRGLAATFSPSSSVPDEELAAQWELIARDDGHRLLPAPHPLHRGAPARRGALHRRHRVAPVAAPRGVGRRRPDRGGGDDRPSP